MPVREIYARWTHEELRELWAYDQLIEPIGDHGAYLRDARNYIVQTSDGKKKVALKDGMLPEMLRPKTPQGTGDVASVLREGFGLNRPNKEA